jgi:hypothetical protein
MARLDCRQDAIEKLIVELGRFHRTSPRSIGTLYGSQLVSTPYFSAAPWTGSARLTSG